ncbi:MAG: undecaprenyl-diphosphate phosphatase, partial [candidate division Zixibacteria bacterium]|nr:undecaprenyl-diphosphate phosphatase [candidate division Zixibacteria bacterium]
PGVSFEILVHLGSLLAVLIYFRIRIFQLIKSLYDEDYKKYRPVVWFIIIGTIPAVIIGLSLKDFFEEAFFSPKIASAMLIMTGLILLSTRFIKKSNKKINLSGAIIMGIGQALAIMPGISRSGTTISAGLIWGLEPSEAAEFSFLLAIPAIAGAVVLNFKDILMIDNTLIGQYLVGALFSFLFSIIAVYSVLRVIRRGKFEYFAYYCFAAGGFGLYLFI